MSQEDNINIYVKKAFKNSNYQGKLIKDRSFENCQFTGCIFNEAVFENCRIDNCTFDNCDLSLVSFKYTNLYKTNINNSKAIGVKWFELDNPFDINFYNTTLSFSSFMGKILKKNKMIDCTAEDVDFTDCNLTQCDFSGTSFTNARFLNSNLTQANFTTAKNYSIDPLHNKLKKAKFSLPEAESFLYLLGIEIV
jgi:fluoroquinolone resistance protein